MDGIHAAVLSVKLKHLDKWTDLRIQHSKTYSEKLIDSDVITPKVIDNGKHVFHLYVIRSKNRNELMKNLKADEIEVAIHYPKALPFLACYTNMNFTEADFPIASQFQDEILSLPMYPELTKEQIESVTKHI